MGCSVFDVTLTALLMLVLLLPLACTEAGHAEPLRRPADREAVYRSTPQRDLRLRVYLPPKADAESESTPRPGVVLFHGGGWLQGGMGHLQSQAAELAALGVVAVCPEYRVRETDGTTPIDALTDALHAFAWVREHADALGIDPERLAAGGGSAGGQLAAACATMTDEKLAELAPALAGLRRPDALILFNPVIDNGPDGYGHERLGDAYRWFSPLHNLRPGLPPTLILLGTDDHLVPVTTAEAYVQAMQAHGNACELELYDGQVHGFFNARPNNPMYRATLDRAILFLQDMQWIEPAGP
ncbi:MAG: alpha/beta hydrolase [Planctomycetota bacterium]